MEDLYAYQDAGRTTNQQRSGESLIDVSVFNDGVIDERVGEDEDDDGDYSHGATRPSERYNIDAVCLRLARLLARVLLQQATAGFCHFLVGRTHPPYASVLGTQRESLLLDITPASAL